VIIRANVREDLVIESSSGARRHEIGLRIRARSLLSTHADGHEVIRPGGTGGLAAYIIALATFALAGALFRTIATLVGNLDEGSAPKREDH
jgi:hypothetical protein